MLGNDFDYDVIVIGAGISGLTAAFNIIQREPLLSILVLEADETVGGRTKPIPMEACDGKAIHDSGGHFVSKRQSHLMSLLTKLGVEIVDYNFTGNRLTEKALDDFQLSQKALLLLGTDVDKDELSCFYRKLDELCKQVSMENPMASVDSNYLDSLTMDEFIDGCLLGDLARKHFKNIVRTTCGSEPVDISPLFYVAYCNSTGGVLAPYLRQMNGGKSSYIKGGVNNLIDKLVTELGEQRILVDTPVTKICRTERDVTVHTLDNKYRCRCTIVAIPPTQIVNMNFDPPLNSGKLSVLQRMKGKRWIKFIATYKEAFWQKKSLNGDVFINPESPKCPVIVVLNISSGNCAALTGLVDVRRLHESTNYDIEVLRQLAKYLGSEALEPLDYIERHWPESKLEGSMFTNPKPGTMQSFHEIRRPIGRLYFAGAETATYWYGHMDGAVQTGLRAALEVLYEIRPQVLCYNDFAELMPRRNIVSFYQDSVAVPLPENAGWLARAAGGVVGTIGAYFGTNIYQNIFGGSSTSNQSSST